MRKQLTSIFAASIVILTLGSCSDIKENDRFIDLPTVTASRAVLLEEYTGQKCVNCPKGHTAIKALLEQYGSRFIAVGIHSGGSAFSIGEGELPGVIGLRVDEGEQYYGEMYGGGLPSGIIDRNSGPLVPDMWAATVYEHITRETPLTITLNAKLSDDGKSVTTEVELQSAEPLTGNIQLWLTESKIIAWQVQPNGKMETAYEHNHVFRSSINGHDGESLSIAPSTPTHYTSTIELKDNWATENLSVVGFYYNESGVVQAAETHVTK